MKTFLLVCAGMADEPNEALGGRTPLEVAKTPFMDRLAKQGSLANAAWVADSLPAADEVAAYSMLGYDPKESYTGLAPLEASSQNLLQNDAQIVFRCDFVTVSADGELVDHTAGKISEKEAQVLVMELNRNLASLGVKIVPLDGYKNLLVIDDSEKVRSLEETDCSSPLRLLGQKTSKGSPKGPAGEFLQQIMDSTHSVLENHDVNRVRIDLGENPASQIWLWGQGRRPKLRPFQEQAGVSGAFLLDRPAWRGLARAAGLKSMRRWEEKEFADFNWIETAGAHAEISKDFKAKIRRVEDFDTNVVGRLLGWIEKKGSPVRVAVTSDLLHSTLQGGNTHTHAPVVFWGEGVPAGGAEAFSEKTCGLSGRAFDPGHGFLQQFMKG